MAFTGVTWDFQQNSTRCSKSSRIHRLETNFHRYAQRFGVFLYPAHPDGSIVRHGLCRSLWTTFVWNGCSTHLPSACVLSKVREMQPVARDFPVFVNCSNLQDKLCSSCILRTWHMKCAYCLYYLPGDQIRRHQQLEIEPARGRGTVTSKSRRQLTIRRCQII